MKALWISLSVLFTTLVVALLFTPQILSTDWGKGIITNKVNKQTGGTLEVGNLSLSWFGTQRIEAVQFKKPNEVSLSFDTFTSDCSVLTLLMRKGDVGKSICTNLDFELFERHQAIQTASSNQNGSKKKKYPPIWKSFSGSFQIENGRIALHRVSAPTLPIELSNFLLEMSSGIFPLRVKSEGKIGNGPYQLDCVLGKDKRTIQADITGFPLALLGNSITDHLGESLNLAITTRDNEMLVSMGTPRFVMNEAPFDVKNGLDLLRPTPFRYMLLGQGSPINGSLKEINVPLENWKQSSFTTDLSAERLSFHSISYMDLQALLRKSAAHETIAISGTSKISSESDIHGYAYLLSDLGVKMEGEWRIDAPKELSNLSLNANGSNLTCQLKGSVDPNGLALSESLTSKVTLRPSQIGAAAQLVKEATVDLEVLPTTLKFQSPFTLEAKAQSEAVNIRFKEAQPAFLFQDIQAEICADTGRDKYALKTLGKLGEGSFTLSLETKAPLEKISSSPAEVQFSCENIATSLLTTYFNQPSLEGFIGTTFGLNYTIEPERRIVLDLKSPKLSFDSTFHIRNQELVLSRPVKLRLADAFNSWERAPSLGGSPLKIESLSKMDATLSSLTLPILAKGFLFPQLDFTPFPMHLDADFNIDNLKLSDKRLNQVALLSQLDLDLSKTAKGGALKFDLDGKVDPSGFIQGEGNIQDLFREDGTINTSSLSSTIKSRLVRVPTVLLDALSVKQELPPSAILGKTLNGEVSLNLKQGSGDIEGKIDASNCYVSLDAQMNQGVISLKKPLEGAMVLTDQMRAALAAKGKVVLLPSREPIKLFISDSGFSLPANNLSLAGLSFSYGRLDLGKMLLKNSGSAEALADIFRVSSSVGTLPLWFAPAEMSMNQGKMRLKRIEVLFANAYDVALWGKVNFRKRFVDMILGLTAGSLRAAFGISGLSPSYVLKAPIRGPLENVEIDKGTAISRIALLIARKNVAPQAGIYGNVLGVIGELADDQSDVPPPRPPFPWTR